MYYEDHTINNYAGNTASSVFAIPDSKLQGSLLSEIAKYILYSKVANWDEISARLLSSLAWIHPVMRTSLKFHPGSKCTS